MVRPIILSPSRLIEHAQSALSTTQSDPDSLLGLSAVAAAIGDRSNVVMSPQPSLTRLGSVASSAAGARRSSLEPRVCSARPP